MPTVEQERLAEVFRRTQLSIRAEALRDALAFYEAADPTDFPREFERIVAQVRPIISLGFDRSQDATSVFFQTNRALAGFGRLNEVPDPIDLSVERVRESLRVTGPTAWAKALQGGRQPRQAMEIAMVRTAGAIGRQVAEGGRQYALDLAEADPRRPRWYRRTSARPCAFCAMLAGRGAVYSSEAGGGFAAHDHCACYPVMTYDGSAPERNQRFGDQYNEAVKAAREEGTLQRGTSNDLLNAFRRSYSP